MDKKTRRKHLNEYTEAARQIELAAVAICVLEGLDGAAAVRCIAALQKEQQRALKRMDRCAEMLGAPYGA
jgi:hypothetical protein